MILQKINTLSINYFLKNKKQGFTLVELIVVITILAILGTIGFISIQNYSLKSRDSNRIATVRTAVTGLTTKVVETGLYPIPDGQTSTGSINGVAVAHKGEFGEGVARAIRYSFPVPKDPLTGVFLPYGVSFNRQYFQLAATLENSTSSYEDSGIIIQDTYAATPASAKVDGNYQGFMKFSSGSALYIANLPSLIWFGSGTLDFTPPATTARFVRDGGSNVAYVFDASTVNSETPAQTVQALTKSPTSTFTGVNITGLTTASSLGNVFTGSTLAEFGGNISSVETVVLGTSGGGGGSVNGTCGSANGKTYASGDTSYGSDTQCGLGNGTASDTTFPAQGGSVNWTCGGSNGGSASSTCTASRSGAVVNGACGTAVSQQHSTTTYSWEPLAATVGPCTMPACNATTIGTIAPAGTCAASVARTCTATNNSVQPSSNLCSIGTASALSGSGPWTWTCSGNGEGTTANCSTLSTNYAGCTYAGQTFTQASTYPGCNTADKLVCTGNGFGYVWSMCNVGTSVSGTSASSYGTMYQWGRNVGFSSGGGAIDISGPLTATGAAATSDFITNGNSPYDWLTVKNDNLWGAANNVSNPAVNNDAIFAKQSSGDMTLMRGPCAAGYHVPTAKEAFDTFSGINGGGFLSAGVITTLPQTALNLPMAGYYYFSAPVILGQGSTGTIWTSSNSGQEARAMEWNGTYFYPYNTYGRAIGMPVRCVKN